MDGNKIYLKNAHIFRNNFSYLRLTFLLTYNIDLYSPNEVRQIFTQIRVGWIENKPLNYTVGFWRDSQSQKPAQFELKVDGPFIGGLVVAFHY